MEGRSSPQGLENPPACVSHRRLYGLAVASLVCSSSLGGLSYMLGKQVLAELHVAHVVLYRFALAALVLLPIVIGRQLWPRLRHLPYLLLTAFLNVPGTFLLQFAGLRFTSAASAAMLVGTLPLILALGAYLVYGEQLGRRGWACIALSSLGVLLVVGRPAAGASWLGNSLVLMSLVVVVAWVLL